MTCGVMGQKDWGYSEDSSAGFESNYEFVPYGYTMIFDGNSVRIVPIGTGSQYTVEDFQSSVTVKAEDLLRT